jgi:hypothetical protein
VGATLWAQVRERQNLLASRVCVERRLRGALLLWAQGVEALREDDHLFVASVLVRLVSLPEPQELQLDGVPFIPRPRVSVRLPCAMLP